MKVGIKNKLYMKIHEGMNSNNSRWHTFYEALRELWSIPTWNITVHTLNSVHFLSKLKTINYVLVLSSWQVLSLCHAEKRKFTVDLLENTLNVNLGKMSNYLVLLKSEDHICIKCISSCTLFGILIVTRKFQFILSYV